MDWNPTLFDLAHALRPAADLEGRLYTAIAQAVGDPVLEMGCGTGRVLLALLRAGVDADGVEYDRGMAEAARRKLDAAGFDRASVSIADMMVFRPPRPYRLVTLPGNTLGSIQDSDSLQRVFVNTAACLAPGGEVAFDVTQVPPGTDVTRFEAPVAASTSPDARSAVYRQRVRFESATATEHVVERVEFDDGEVLEHRTRLRVWTRAQLEDAFGWAGLSFRRPPLDETGQPPSPSSRLLFARLTRTAD